VPGRGWTGVLQQPAELDHVIWIGAAHDLEQPPFVDLRSRQLRTEPLPFGMFNPWKAVDYATNPVSLFKTRDQPVEYWTFVEFLRMRDSSDFRSGAWFHFAEVLPQIQIVNSFIHHHSSAFSGLSTTSPFQPQLH